MEESIPDLAEQINYTNEQITFHTSQSERKKANGTPTHASIRHEKAVTILIAIERSLVELEINLNASNLDNATDVEDLFSINANDIEELPDSLKDVLNLQTSEILDVQIVELLRLANRPLTMKELIMGLYRKYDYEVPERNPFASKLYRMKDQGLIDSIKKGHYILPDTTNSNHILDLEI